MWRSSVERGRLAWSVTAVLAKSRQWHRVKKPSWMSRPSKLSYGSRHSCHLTAARWETALKTIWIIPVNPQNHEIRNYFIKLLHLLGSNRKLEHYLSVKTWKQCFLTIGNRRGQMVLKRSCLPYQGRTSVQSNDSPEYYNGDPSFKKICHTNVCRRVEKNALTTESGISIILTLIIDFWRLGWRGK